MVYKFTLINKLEQKTKLRPYKDVIFHTNTLNCGILYKDGTLIINKGYSWDGCSPKFSLFHKIIGVYDGKKINGKQILYYPSLQHDITCQFKNELRANGVSHYDIDRNFLNSMIRLKFRFAFLYYFFVRIYSILRYGRS